MATRIPAKYIYIYIYIINCSSSLITVDNLIFLILSFKVHILMFIANRCLKYANLLPTIEFALLQMSENMNGPDLGEISSRARTGFRTQHYTQSNNRLSETN